MTEYERVLEYGKWISSIFSSENPLTFFLPPKEDTKKEPEKPQEGVLRDVNND